MTAQHLPRTTQAIVLSRYGSPDVLALGDVPMPTLADDAILVRVQAASLHGRSMARLGGLTRPRLRGLCVHVAGG